MRDAGYYWVRCALADCGCAVNAEVAYYEPENVDYPWVVMASEVPMSEDTFEVLGHIAIPQILEAVDPISKKKFHSMKQKIIQEALTPDLNES